MEILKKLANQSNQIKKKYQMDFVLNDVFFLKNKTRKESKRMFFKIKSF